MEVMDYEMEDPQDSLNRTLIPQCPFTRASIQPTSQTQPVQQQQPLAQAPPLALGTFGFHPIPPGPPMESFSPPPPGQVDPQNGVQATPEALRPPSSRPQANQGQSRQRERSSMTGLDPGDGYSPFGTINTPASPHDTSASHFHRPSAYAAAYHAESRPERPYPTSPLAQEFSMHPNPAAQLGLLGNNARTLSGPADHGRARMQNPLLPSQVGYLGAVMPTVQPEERHLPSAYPFAHHVHAAPPSAFSPRTRSSVHGSENQMPQAPARPPNAAPQQSRPGYAFEHPRMHYPPSSYASLLTGAHSHQSIEDVVSRVPDLNSYLQTRDNNIHPMAMPLSPQPPDLASTAIFQDYLASGRFERSVQRSFENGELTEPGRPLQDYHEFITSRPSPMMAGNAPPHLRAAQRSMLPTMTGPRGPGFEPSGPRPAGLERPFGAASPRTRRELVEDDETWSMALSRSIHEREQELALMLENNRGTPWLFHHGPRRATSKAIESLQKVDIEGLEQEDRTCSICMEPFGEAEPTEGKIEHPVKLPCGHIFGFTCIRTWLRENCTCPSCRRKVESEVVMKRPNVVLGRHTLQRHARSEQDSEHDVGAATTARPHRRRRTSEVAAARFGSARSRAGSSRDEPSVAHILGGLRFTTTTEPLSISPGSSAPSSRHASGHGHGHSEMHGHGPMPGSSSSRRPHTNSISSTTSRTTSMNFFNEILDEHLGMASTSSPSGGGSSRWPPVPVAQMTPIMPVHPSVRSITPALPTSARDRDNLRWGRRSTMARGAASRRSEVLNQSTNTTPTTNAFNFAHATTPTVNTTATTTTTTTATSDPRRRYAHTDPPHSDATMYDSPEDSDSE